MTTELPDDILLAIFGHLELGDIPTLRLVNRKFNELSHAGGLWKRILLALVAQQSLPIPGLHGLAIDEAEGRHLESLLKRAVDLQMNWTSPNPTVKHTTDFSSTIASGRVIFMRFLKRARCNWLLTMTILNNNDPPPERQFVLECWDVSTARSSTPPVCLARKTLKHPVSVVVNQSDSTGTEEAGDVAVRAPFIVIYSIRPDPAHPDNGFVPTAQFPDKRGHLFSFSASTIVTTEENDGRILAWDTKRPNDAVELRNSEVGQNIARTVLAATVSDRVVVIVTTTTCESYTLPSVPAQSAVIHPTSQWKWPWTVDSAALASSQNTPPHHWSSGKEGFPPTISLLLRFASGFPWPINLLHQYELVRNPQYASKDVSEAPYQFPPTMRQMIASPIRLFAQTDMAIGPYGTSIWIDNHTEDHFDHGQQAQRLAARVMVPTTNGEEGDLEDTEEDEDSGQGPGEPPSHVTSTLDVSVMGWNEQDSWVKLALDEDEGTVALGHLTGKITLFSYLDS